jgi:tetratricopeptide (TPR) repeat protein
LRGVIIMVLELSLLFPNSGQVTVQLTEGRKSINTEAQPFASPFTEADQRELQWYLEVYPAYYTTEVDDVRAARIAGQLPSWGAALFTAVFQHPDAARLIDRFQNTTETGRLLTINSNNPMVLAQPWELLRDPTGTYLFLERPPISLRRRFMSKRRERRSFAVKAKDRLHLLVMVSRPTDIAFIDPRADWQAVQDALEAQVPGRVVVEFLRPATLNHLLERLEDERLPPVDILHFDGHGAYDPDGRLTDEVKRAFMTAGLSLPLPQEAERKSPQGYLLFERIDGTQMPISAGLLGAVLYRQRVGLIVLSACQSAMIGGEDPIGSVAAQLIHAGLPTVLTMTHSVLVATIRALFGHFYGDLARGSTVGAALDYARRQLYADPKRGERQRGQERNALTLQDWFVPALYQAGRDPALLTKSPVIVPAPVRWGNLPAVQESGFHGRTHELWLIERAFVTGIRRLVVHGFGGQGKTTLAAEASRWLHRTGMFARVCMVNYADFQGVDPVSLAVNTLSTVLDRSLLDAAAATAALTDIPTLLILDHLEMLGPEPRRELLDTAGAWSEAGASRVLLTTREPDLNHPAYPTGENLRCQYLELDGLAPEDALAWFQAIMQLPPAPQVPLPAREALLALFERVGFHPLSVRMLAQELKRRRITELSERLEIPLQEAKLNLSLERLAPEVQPWLLQLGVFQGGAFEDNFLSITEIPEAEWPPLRQKLEATGLIQVETVPGVTRPFLRFHPMLAPALWERLTPDEQAHLAAQYRQVYYALSSFLHMQDESQHIPAVRVIAQLELPNLLVAVSGALEASETWAVDFVRNVNWFLDAFGRGRERAQLTARAQAAAGEVGSQSWYLARRAQGEQLYNTGRFHEAAAFFQELLAHLGEAPSYERSVILTWLGRCYARQDQVTQAEILFRQAIEEATRLEPSPNVWRHISTLQTYLGDVLGIQGDFASARAAYERALAIGEELGDLRSIAVDQGQLGSLALQQGNLEEAEQRYRNALVTFQQLEEPAMQAGVWHQLGIIYQEAQRWGEAERAYRESVRLGEAMGDLAGVVRTWDQLGQLMAATDNYDAAEAWFHKALESRRAIGDRAGEARTLHKLALLLRDRPDHLAEARERAETALAIKKTLDPAAAQIWNTYGLLADIADKEGRTAEAQMFRRQEREEWARFRGARYELRRYAPLIAAIVTVVGSPKQRPALEEVLEAMAKRGWGQLVAAIRHILDGERNVDVLSKPLDREDALIVQVTLQGIENPDTLSR